MSGCLDYFPDALAAVAELSRIGNDQHNPGEPLHWARAKSGDEADALVRHLMERGTFDTDGVRHSVKVAWRALANLQKELEAAGAPMSRGSREADGEIHWEGAHRRFDAAYPHNGYFRGEAEIPIEVGEPIPVCTCGYIEPCAVHPGNASADSDDNQGALKHGEAV